MEKVLFEIDKIDVLINCAGINTSKCFAELEENDWSEIYEVNLFGVARVIRHALPALMRAQKPARIINIGSVKGTYSAVGRVAYASSKAAVINLTTGLAKELAPNILVNCVSPGFTQTEMTDKTWTKRVESQVESILLGRIAMPSEVAKLVLFLSSADCTYITGQNINIDGGFGIKNV